LNGPLHAGWSFERVDHDTGSAMHIRVFLRFMVDLAGSEPILRDGDGPVHTKRTGELGFRLEEETCTHDGLPAVRLMLTLILEDGKERRVMDMTVPDAAIVAAGLPLDDRTDRLRSAVEYARRAHEEASGETATILLEGAAIVLSESRSIPNAMEGLRPSTPWSPACWPAPPANIADARKILNMVDAHSPRTIAFAVERRERKRVDVAVRAHRAVRTHDDFSIHTLRSIAAVPDALRETLR